MPRSLCLALGLAAMIAGCGSSSPLDRRDAASLDQAGDVPGAGRPLIDVAYDLAPDSAVATCAAGAGSDLDGVSIAIDASRCTFTLAEAATGLAIPYAIAVSHDVVGVLASPQDGGRCSPPGASGLYPFEVVSGGGQSYCLCDSGLCASPPRNPLTIAAGRYVGSFTWDGRNWSGPSDTGNPKGPPFPAGTYSLRVSVRGTVHDADAGVGAGAAYEVWATLPIVLTGR